MLTKKLLRQSDHGPGRMPISNVRVPAATWPDDWAFDLAGQTAIVTGVEREIGRSVALALATGGANVVVSTRNDVETAESLVEQVRATGGRAIAAVGEVSDPESAARLVLTATKAFGRVDHICHDGTHSSPQSLIDISFDDWDRVIRHNLSSGFYLAKNALPHMMVNHFGRFVLIGGSAGSVGASGRAHNVAAEAGVIGLMKAIALEYGRWNITANVVVPGALDTARGSLPEYPDPPARHLWDTALALPRLGTSEDLSYCVRFLLSRAAPYVTGQTVHVNGGLWMP